MICVAIARHRSYILYPFQETLSCLAISPWIKTIFHTSLRGMNIDLQALLMFIRASPVVPSRGSVRRRHQKHWQGRFLPFQQRLGNGDPAPKWPVNGCKWMSKDVHHVSICFSSSSSQARNLIGIIWNHSF